MSGRRLHSNDTFSLLREKPRIIGWGAGGLFHYYHTIYPLPLPYIIDSESSLWGKRSLGVDIFPPEYLAKEDPIETLIIIYSSFSSEIEKQIESFGPFTAVTASAFFSIDKEFLKKSVEVEKNRQIKKNEPESNNCLLVQGPVYPNLTLSILKVFALLFPKDLIILSTWQGTKQSLIDELSPYVDITLQSEPPPYNGVQNRNFQIVSTQKGIEAAKRTGVSKILKTRTDLFLQESNLFLNEKHVRNVFQINNFGNEREVIDNRLIIPQTFTRKFLPFSPSDLVMIGNVNVMETYWDIPLDLRNFNLFKECRSHCLAEISRCMLSTECYLGVNFAKKRYQNISFSLSESWNFFRDNFIVVDNSWFGIYWPKYPHIPDKFPVKLYRENIKHLFWQALFFNDDRQMKDEINKVDIGMQKWI